MNEDQLRKIRSFVRREGRKNQEHSEQWPALWQKYGFDINDCFSGLFSNKAPVILEIGFGDGANLLAQAKEHSQYNFIGIDVYRTGAFKLMRHLDSNDINNVRVACSDAVEILNNFIPDKALAKVLVFFPDPWQKKRHHKRRLLQSRFFELVWKKLEVQAEVFIATDWQNYADGIDESLEEVKDFFQKGHFNSQRCPYRILTKFEGRAIKEQRAISEFHLIPLAK